MKNLKNPQKQGNKRLNYLNVSENRNIYKDGFSNLGMGSGDYMGGNEDDNSFIVAVCFADIVNETRHKNSLKNICAECEIQWLY